MSSAGFGGYRRAAPAGAALRLDLNEAPRETSGAFRRRFLEILAESSWRRYPDIDAYRTRELAAALYGWEADCTLVGNGSNELLAATIRASLPPGGVMLTLSPSFSMYPVLARRAGARLESVALRPPHFAIDGDELLERAETADLVVLASPNNPTGGEVSQELLAALLELGRPVIWDAAYVDFTGVDPCSLLESSERLIVLRSLSKAWALAGMRAGALLSDAVTVERVARELLPFGTGWAVDAAFSAALEVPAEREAIIRETAAERERQIAAIRALRSFEAVDSRGNFFLLRRVGSNGEELRSALLERGIAVREVPELAADGYVRVTVGTPAEGGCLIAALGEVADG